MNALLQHRKKRVRALGAATTTFLFLATVSGLATVEKDFFQNADLNNGNNYNPPGLPVGGLGGGSDVLLTTTSTSLTVNGGSLTMGSLNQLNNLAYVISDGGTITLNPFNNVVGANANDAIYLGGSNSSLSILGTLSLQVSGSGICNFDVAQAGSTLNVAARIDMLNTNTLTKTGAGMLNLSGQYVVAGQLMVINGGTTNFLAGFSNVNPAGLAVNNLNTGPGTAVTLNVQTSVQFHRGLTGMVATPSSGTNTAIVNISGSSTVLTLGIFGVGGGAYAGTIAGDGSVLLSFGVSTLTQTFSGNNTYTGTTTVNGGTLRINGTTSGQGNYVVASSSTFATLTGSGTIGLAPNGTIAVGSPFSSHRLSAGADSAAGTLNVVTSGTGGVILGDHSIYLADIGPSGTSDLLAIAGGYIDLTSSTDTLTLNGLAGAFDGYDYTIATFAQNLNGGTFQTVSGLATGYVVQYNPTSIKLLAPQLPLQMTAAVSRKMHGPSGSFDVNLLTTEPVECRSSGGSHTLVFTFSNLVVGGSAAVTTGKGQVSGAPTFSGKTMTVNLAGVSDVQKLGVTLHNVTDRFSQVAPDTTFTINMLVGDVNADRVVNSGDALLTRNRSGSVVNATIFQSDINIDGVVNSGDTVIIRAGSGNGLP
jgi:autotransporter-associated beta strand protein